MKRRSLQLALASVLVFTACCAGLFLVKIRPAYTYKIQHESDSEPHFAYERGWPWTWKTQVTTDRASPMLATPGYIDWPWLVADVCVAIAIAVALSLFITWLLDRIRDAPGATSSCPTDDIRGNLAMLTSDESRRDNRATVGRAIIRLLDMGFLAMGLLGLATGMVLFVVGILDVTDYSVELILFGPMILLVFLVMLLAWGFSYRLAVLSRMQRDMQRDLRELLRRT